MDPWYDYLAFPVAPIVLLVQVAALFLRPAWLRITLTVAGAVAIAAMAAYISSLPDRPGEGVNIGAAILILWLLASLGLLGVAAVREVAPLLLRGLRETPSSDRRERRT
jgi:phosphatidylserine synthase